MPLTAAERRETSARIRKYIGALPAGPRRAVKQVRAAIRAAAPRAVEHFSYGIPGFRLDDKPLLWYAGWKTHVAVYPITRATASAHAARIKPFRKGRGTLHFPLAAKLPLALITAVARTRAREIRSIAKG